MIHHFCLSGAIIAVNPGFGVLELLGHGLSLNCSIQVSELHLHVEHTPAADRASVGGFDMLIIALSMDTVTTSHENHSPQRGEHVFATYRAITIDGSFNAFMAVFHCDRQTNTTCLRLHFSVYENVTERSRPTLQW